MIGRLIERDQLGVPVDRDAMVGEFVAEDPLVLVLSEHQDERDTG